MCCVWYKMSKRQNKGKTCTPWTSLSDTYTHTKVVQLSDGWFLRLLQVVPAVEMEKHRRLTAADLYLLAITPISKPEDNTPTPPPNPFYPPLTHTHTHKTKMPAFAGCHEPNPFLQSDKFVSCISALKPSSFFYLTWSQTCISASH